MKKGLVFVIFLGSWLLQGSVFATAIPAFSVDIDFSLSSKKIERNVPFAAVVTTTITGTGASCGSLSGIE